MRKDIQPGARFPDYELPDHTGTQRKLSELQGGSPMVLHLSRGGYDPKEHWQIRRLAEAYPEFKVGYTQVVTISTDDQLATIHHTCSKGIITACSIPVNTLQFNHNSGSPKSQSGPFSENNKPPVGEELQTVNPPGGGTSKAVLSACEPMQDREAVSTSSAD